MKKDTNMSNGSYNECGNYVKPSIRVIVHGHYCEDIDAAEQLYRDGKITEECLERARAKFNRPATPMEIAWEVEEVTETIW